MAVHASRKILDKYWKSGKVYLYGDVDTLECLMKKFEKEKETVTRYRKSWIELEKVKLQNDFKIDPYLIERLHIVCVCACGTLFTRWLKRDTY